MRRLLIVNNIPSHYRTFMFNKMSEKAPDYDIDLTVAFQAERLSYRPWNPDLYEMRFPHFISTGINPWGRHPKAQFTSRTFNTDILREVVLGGYNWVLVAPFMSLGTGAAALLPSGSTQKLLWSESNLTSARHLRGPARIMKQLLLHHLPPRRISNSSRTPQPTALQRRYEASLIAMDGFQKVGG